MPDHVLGVILLACNICVSRSMTVVAPICATSTMLVIALAPFVKEANANTPVGPFQMIVLNLAVATTCSLNFYEQITSAGKTISTPSALALSIIFCTTFASLCRTERCRC